MKILPIMLGIVAFLEFFCGYFYKYGNVWLFNIMNYIHLNFYAYLFYQYLEGISKKILIGMVAFFNVFYLSTFVFGWTDFMNESASYGQVAGIIILIIMLIMVFNQMLRIDQYEGLTRNLLFWICFSMLVLHATTLPLFSITRWSDILGDFRYTLIRILIFSIIVSHAILIFGFIWSKKKYTY